MSFSLFRRSRCPGEYSGLMKEFETVVLDQSFPCFFATSAHKRDELLFAVVSEVDDLPRLEQLMDSVASHINEVDNDQVFVLWVTGESSHSLDGDERIAIRFLQNLSDISNRDTGRADRALDSSSSWNFRYKEIEQFLNFSTSNHKKRMSRNLGAPLTIVLQEQATFTRLDASGGNFRDRIRARVEDYDDIPLSPHLGTHGDKPELYQYFLGDSNTYQFGGAG